MNAFFGVGGHQKRAKEKVSSRLVGVRCDHLKAEAFLGVVGVLVTHRECSLPRPDAPGHGGFDRFEKGAAFRAPVSPAAALRRLEASPERFEPALVALLQDVIGRYPRGTLLQIAGGAVAIVIDGGARWGDRPVVRRLVHPDGTKDELLTDAEIARPELIVGEVEPDEHLRGDATSRRPLSDPPSHLSSESDVSEPSVSLSAARLVATGP